MLEKCVQTVLELNWNQRLGHKKTKLNICDHMLTSSAQLQNRSFHVVERTRTSSKCQKMKKARAKRAKILFFIVKYANLWGFLLPSLSWLLKLPMSLSTACKELKIAQIAQLNQLFQLLHLAHIYGHCFYYVSRMLMSKQ